MIIGIPKETSPGERRVALVPESGPRRAAAGREVRVEPGAGADAGFPDRAYEEKGARITPDLFGEIDLLLNVRPPMADEIAALREGAALIGLLEPYADPERTKLLAARKLTSFAMEL